MTPGTHSRSPTLSLSHVLQSAKSNLNVENVFFTIARDIKQRLAETTEATKPEVGFHLQELRGISGNSRGNRADRRGCVGWTVEGQHCNQGQHLLQVKAQIVVLLRELSRRKGRREVLVILVGDILARYPNRFNMPIGLILGPTS